MQTIERSPGIGIGHGYIVGGGHSGTTADLDATVQRAAEILADAYRMPVTIRFNSDRYSGGAWLKTDEPDGVWLNAEVGICADLVTAERNARFAAKYPEMADGLREPGIYLCARVGQRVSDTPTYQPAATIAEALAYVQTHADLSRLS